MKIKIIQIWDQKNGTWKDKILQNEEIDDFKTTSIPMPENTFISDYKNAIKNIKKTKIMSGLGYNNKKEMC